MVFGRFWTDRKAGVAPMLAVAFIPLVGAIGAAVDYSRAASMRTAMQTALDSAGLMLSKEAQNLTQAQLEDKTVQYFNALFTHTEVGNVAVTPVLTQGTDGMYKLDLTATGTIDTIIWRVVGTPQIGLTTSAQIVWGIHKLNLALALDNTGSMAQNNKMTELKKAAHSLLTTLENAARTPGDIKVSIVPFATDVNIGDNIDGSYIDWTDWDNKNGSCSKSSYTTQSNCTSKGYTWTAAARSTWNGCVWDRDQNNDVMDTAAVAGSTATMFGAHQAANCSTKMMPLSYDWTALGNKVDAMTPTGNTNVTIGLAWAFQTLSPNAPLNAPSPADDLDKVVILLTDGDNTQNRWSTSSTAIDARTQKACANIKAANIKIYTVRVIDGNASLLKSCATKSSMYYEVSDASQLNSVFNTIAQSLATLRLTK